MDTLLTPLRVGLRRRSDDEVFALALDGDSSAFTEVYRRYKKRVYGYCLARLMEPESAADATQEVFIRLLKEPRQDVHQPSAWLFGIARNVAIDIVRKRSRTMEVADSAIAEDTAALPTARAADAEYLGREETRNIFVALRRMRPRYRTALILREMHHESSADMALALGTSPGAIDTLVSRARDAFGKAYAEVSGLQAECKDAVTAIYQRTGTGLTEDEEARLEAHLATCPKCREEARQAARLDRLSALLPFLMPRDLRSLNPFERAAASLGNLPDLAVKLGYALSPERLTPMAKIVAGLIAVSAVTAPVVAAVTANHTPDARRPAISAPGHTTPNAHVWDFPMSDEQSRLGPVWMPLDREEFADRRTSFSTWTPPTGVTAVTPFEHEGDPPAPFEPGESVSGDTPIPAESPTVPWTPEGPTDGESGTDEPPSGTWEFPTNGW